MVVFLARDQHSLFTLLPPPVGTNAVAAPYDNGTHHISAPTSVSTGKAVLGEGQVSSLHLGHHPQGAHLGVPRDWAKR